MRESGDSNIVDLSGTGSLPERAIIEEHPTSMP
jgi:hypothetical protein